MQLSNAKAKACLLAIFGCLLFVILSVIAMLVFPGGLHGNVATTGYTFTQNFFSDLGGTVTPTGLPNPVSSVFFFIALVSIGLLTVPFLMVLPTLYRGQKFTVLCICLGSLIGCVSAVGFIGIAFTPWNLFLNEHIFFVQVAFVTLIPMSLCYLVAIVATRQPVIPRKYALVLVEFTVAALLYFYLLFYGPASTTMEGLFINAVGQKLIVYNCIAFVLIMAYASYRVLAPKRNPEK